MSKYDLSKDETARYSRQMLCPEFGKTGQMKLKNASVLIVGAGGLGCPSSLYLAAAGVGHIGLVDHDKVETSNLHRQVLHSEKTIGVEKVQSASDRLRELNSNIKFTTFPVGLTKDNAFDIIEPYDVVIDGTDNPMARYLLSDVCVILNKPLVSGSALKFDGQITVYNASPDSPCYRCVFPEPPPAGTVTNCADGGVLGVVPGIIGNLQAMETIKILSGLGSSYDGVLLIYSGLKGSFREVKLRKSKQNCASCGEKPTITRDLLDYNAFCGVTCAAPIKILEPEERVTAQEYSEYLKSGSKHLLIDVRPLLHQQIIKLDHSITIPLGVITTGDGVSKVEELGEKLLKDSGEKVGKIFVMCRRGNASQKAVRELKNRMKNLDSFEIKDVIGGIGGWAQDIDPDLPMY